MGPLALVILLAAVVDDAAMCSTPPGTTRLRGAEPASAARVHAFMRKVGANRAKVEDPCVSGLELGRRCTCARTALESFFAALDETASAGTRTGIVVFGNSLIASDGITDIVRARLVREFSDGGRGLLLADRIGTHGPRARTAAVASGWRVENVAAAARPSAPLGATGVQHVSEGPAFSRFALRGDTHATIFWGGAPLSMRVDDGPWLQLDVSADPAGAQVTQLELAASDETLTLRAERGGAVVQGVSLEHGGGVVLDTLGVPSADASLWLGADRENFEAQLRARDPRLVMIMLGGNETKRISWGRSTRESIDRDLRALIGRTRGATGAACLVVGPIDAVVGPAHEDPWRERPTLRAVIEIERSAALGEGCAFLDLYAAMGGRGSLRRLSEQGAVWEDFVHPRGLGLDLLGELVADALLDSYARSQPVSVLERRAQMTFGGT